MVAELGSPHDGERAVGGKVRVAVVNDYDLVVVGVAKMLDPYRDRVIIAELDAERSLKDQVDIALYDTFAQAESDQAEIEVLLRNPRARRIAVFTWNFHPHLVSRALDQGASGYLSKCLGAAELVTALEAINAGEVVVAPPLAETSSGSGLDWPGRTEGLTEREAEILALITQGKSNAEVAATLFLSENTIKSYIRRLYRKIGVDKRSRAVLWGARHGFMPDHDRIESWRGGP
jgi:DNA-binding NarL/FixJ family response regulator